jgi:hypothetical protein
LPSWLPGMRFKSVAEEWHRNASEMINRPFWRVQEEVVR